MNSSRLLALSLVCLVGTSLANAQEAKSVRTETGSFLFARYASRGASVLYAGYRMGWGGVFFGVVDNPKTGYNELIAGMNTRWVWERARSQRSLMVGLAAADISDGDYAQLYVIPSYSRGRFSATGTLELYQPLDHRGTKQGEVNPVQAFWRLNPRWSIGASSVVGFGDGFRPYARGGPAVKLDVPRGEVVAEYLWNVERNYEQLRVGFQASL